MSILSPLRYPGGKSKISNFFKQFVKDNGLLDGVYVEPYAGGASIALSLLFDEYVSKIIINDKDRSIYAFWHSVLYDTENLCRLIAETPVTMENWKKLRELQKIDKKDQASLLDLGFSTFFMNRTNRSGIIKAGVIGGYAQTGNYKMDARYRKDKLMKRIRRIASYADRIELHNEDAVDFIQKIANQNIDKTILYLDPPYYKKGQGLYMNYYKDSDHRDIKSLVSRLGQMKWVVSYDNSEFIKSLYQEFRHQEFRLNYSANNNGTGTEVIFFSDNCLLTPEALDKLHLKKEQ